MSPIDFAVVPVAAMAAALGLLGLCIGSFLNVCIYRIPLGQSVVHPPSRCMRCGNGLRWYHNVPIVGWLMLGGRCYDCGSKIGVKHLIIEMLFAALFVAIAVATPWL